MKLSSLDQRTTLDAIAEALLERETLETRDLEILARGEPLPPLPSPASSPEPGSATESTSPSGSKGRADEYPTRGRQLPDPEPMPS